jgi:hypothetical protein
MDAAKKRFNAILTRGVTQDDFLVVARTIGEEWRVNFKTIKQLPEYLVGLSEDTITLINAKRIFDRAFSGRE